MEAQEVGARKPAAVPVYSITGQDSLMRCTDCNFTRWNKVDGLAKNEDGNYVRMWRCARCGHKQFGYVPWHTQKSRQLYFDLETSIMQVGVFDLKINGGYISPDAILKPSFVLCWAAGWVGEKEIFSGVVTPAQAKRCDDTKIIKPLWDLLNEADCVIGHNAQAFDVKKINTRFILAGYEPPAQFQVVDTLKVARKNFKFESNKMDYISGRLGGLKKHKMELQDWIDCSNGDPDALDKMVRYCRNDIAEGKGLYEKMLQWIPAPRGQTVRAEAMR